MPPDSIELEIKSKPLTPEQQLALYAFILRDAASWILAARKEHPELLPPAWVYEIAEEERA